MDPTLVRLVIAVVAIAVASGCGHSGATAHPSTPSVNDAVHAARVRLLPDGVVIAIDFTLKRSWIGDGVVVWRGPAVVENFDVEATVVGPTAVDGLASDRDPRLVADYDDVWRRPRVPADEAPSVERVPVSFDAVDALLLARRLGPSARVRLAAIGGRPTYETVLHYFDEHGEVHEVVDVDAITAAVTVTPLAAAQ